jgi:multidrug efflux pump subunit AcrA (membrane-fusion protein)
MTSRNAVEEPEEVSASRGRDVEHIYVERVPSDGRKMRRVLIAAVAGLVVLLLVYVGFVRRRAATAAPAASTAAAPAAPVPISTVAAVKQEIPVYIQTTGSLTPYETTDVASQVAGRVVSTPVDAGAYVRQGTVIARLDDRDARLRVEQAQAAVSQAEAAVKQARANLGLAGGQQLDPERVPEVASARSQMELAEANERRYRALVETGDVPQAQYDEFRSRAETARKAYEAAVAKARSGGAGIDMQLSALESARAQLGMARKALADCVITAPLSGYVANRQTAVGEWVTTSSVIATIVQNDTLKLLLQVAEADAARVREGMPVRLRVDAFPDREFAGTVAEIIPALDTASRSLIAVVGVLNPDGALKPGMFATARVVEPSAGKVGILVPAQAVIRSATGSGVVYVVANDRAEARAVQTGQEVDGMVQIVEGVAEGEEVATAGADKLADGATIVRSAR